MLLKDLRELISFFILAKTGCMLFLPLICCYISCIIILEVLYNDKERNREKI